MTAIALTSSCCGPTSRRASAFLIFSDSEIRLFIADLQRFQQENLGTFCNRLQIFAIRVLVKLTRGERPDAIVTKNFGRKE
ncbi:hypothetical protein [Phaeobacter italicus]|uniref:hypothetical protein n=1 Tax=Phaeobacter italicus TaxID=481446 RepID=UPI001CD7B8F6|nr:hypothetical protein [Phaeobacter italicus]MCA0858278.1 hypothetical protein [Phaeobacter italicus]